MNKKIYKGYELAEAVDNGILDLEQRVKSFNDMEYYNCTINFILRDNAKNVMFKEFKILEDNTEKIEEIGEFVDLIGMNENEEELFKMIRCCTHKIDELVKLVNKMKEGKEQ